MANLAKIVPNAAKLDARAAELRAQAIPPNTRRAYNGAWRRFTEWCASSKRKNVPAAAGTLASYIAYMADEGAAVSYIELALAAIDKAHQLLRQPSARHDALVKETLRGLARERGGSKPHKKAALTADLLTKVVAEIPVTLSGLRDRALLLVGFATARRGIELLSFNAKDVEFRHEGAVLIVRNAKTLKPGDVFEVPIHYSKTPEHCPVRALKLWLGVARIKEGPIFRPVHKDSSVGKHGLSRESLAKTIKKACARVGLDAKDFSTHSLRRGFMTTAGRAKVPLETIMRHTGHANADVARGYIEDSRRFEDDAGRGLL